MKTTSVTSADSAPSQPRSYSLVEAAQLLGLSLAALHGLLVRHELHTEAGPRGSRISRGQLLRYLTRRESAEPTGVNFFMGFGSNR